MGNEASLEGVEGGLLGLPEGVASDGKGGYIRVPAGMEADLSQLSEDERKQIAAVMSRARAKPPENAGDAPSQRKSDADANHQPRLPGNPPAQGPSGISKSRTVDAFRTGPPARRAPGRSPSSVSLLESRSRQEAKQEPRVSMFSSNFLSGANPLSAVSSAVNKFSLFGDEEEDEAKKQQKPAQQQSGPGKVPQQQQGPPKQNQSPPQQRAAPQHGPGPQRQGPPGPQQRGPGAPPQQQGPVPNTGVPGQKSLCPLCKTTELNLQTKEQANYNTCTQCRSVVCSLCGFSPPDSAVKEWLCLNCQMQRALGGMDPPGPPAPKQAPPAATQPAKAEPTKPPEARKPPALTKQKTVTDTGKPATPPATPPAVQRGPDPAQEKPKPQGGPDPAPQQSKPAAPSALKELPGPDEGKSAVAETPPSQTKTPTPARDPAKAEQQPPQQRPLQEQGPPPGQQPPGGAPKADPKATGPPQQQPGKPQQQVPKEGPGPSPAKPVPPPQAPPPKQESGFFGLSFGGLTEATKPPSAGPQPPAESAAGKLFGFGGFTDSPKPPAAAESVTGKLFGFGGFSDTPKPPTASAPPPADSVSGKMFGFGGFSDTPKPPAASAPPPADSVSGKMFGFGGFSDTPKPPAASAPPPADSVSGKMFGFGGFSDTPKPPAASAPPPADSVSGKMFGFGSSIFSSASNLITSSVQEEPPPQVSAQPKTTPPPQQGQGPPSPHEKKPIHGAERPKAAEPSAAPTKAQPNCPLCKVELNVGSQDPPNYNTCTECKKTVCDLCGFNPMPHMTENEWLCLNCQTQRALAGQLGDMGKMPPPMPAPVKPASQQTATPKSQPSPPKTTSVPTEPGPGKPSPDQQKTSPADTVSPSPSSSATIPPASAPELSPAPPEPEAVPPEPSPAPPEPEAVPPEPSPAPPEPEAVPPEPSPAPPEPEAAPPEPSPAPPEPTALAPENNVPPQESTPPVKVTAPEPTSPPPENAARPPEPTSPPPDKGVSPEPTHPSEIFEASEPTTPPPEKVIPKPSSPPPEKLVCHFEPATPPEKVGIPDSTIPPPEKVATSDPLDLTAPPSEHTIPPPEDDMAPESTTHPSEIVVASEPTAPPTDQFAGPEATSPPPEKAAPPSEHTTSADNVVAPETTSHPSEIVAASKHTTPAPEKIAGPECTSPPSEKAEPPSELTKPPAEMVVTPEPTAHPSEVIVASEPTTPPPQKVADPESTSTPLEKAEPPSELTTPPAEKVVTPEPTAHPSEVIVAYEPTTPPEKVADPESTSTPLEKAAPPSELNSPPPEKLLAPESTTHPAEIVVASKPTTPPTEKVAGPESTATPLEKDTPPSELTTPSQDKVGVSEPTSFPLEKVSAPEPPSLPPEKDAPPYEPTTSLPEKVVAPEINTSPPEEAAAPEPTTLLPDHTDVPPELALVPQQSTTSTSELNAAFLQSAASTPKSEYMEAVVQEIEEERHLVVQAREFVPEPIQTPHTATDNMQATPFTQGQGTEPSAPSTAVIEQTCAPTEALDKQSPVTQEKSTAEQLTETDAEAGELKEEIISDTIDSCQQKSPQGLSDTGHPSDGISSSLGEIPAVAPTREKEPLKEPVQTENVAEESSLTGPSDVKMSESLALSVSEGGPGSSEKEDPYTIDDQELNCQETKKLPISLEGSGSLKEEMGQTQERVESLTDASHGGDPMKFQKTKEASLRRNQSYDSDKDKDGSEPLTMPQMRVKTSEVPSSSNEHKQDHLGSGKDNELVQKKITGTSRNQVLAADEDNCMQQQIKEPELKCEENKSKGELKSTSGKSKRFLKKSVRHDDDDPVQQKSNEQRHDESPATNVDEAKSQEVQEHTTISRRTYPTLCAERALTDIQASEGKTQEMEKLPDSPEDRSRADGSSSLHASSFTSGTSPTSVSSLDEDSEESQSHKGLSGESKHRKAKDRQQAQGLPTTEDYSEEEGLHEEGELLYQEEMQLELGQRQPQKKKTFSQKLNRDKEELLAQLGLEHQKTPPGSLFPIKDASPTDEIPQAAAMEETNKSSYSDISQSIESEPEGFVSNTKKIHDVHKVHQVPMAVDAYSPTNEQHTEIITDTVGKPLKGADEAYEAIMQKQTRQVNETHQNETFVPPVISQTCYVTISSSDSAPLAKDDKPLLDAEAAYEKLMKRQGPILTLETTTTKSVPDLQESAEVVIIPARDDEKENAVARGSGEEPEALPLPFDSPIKRALRPIPDLKITQCSSGEEDFEEEESITPENEVAVSLISPEDKTASEFEQTSITIHAPIPTPTGTTTELEPMSVVCEVPQLMSTPTTYPVSVPTIDMVSDFPEMEQISVVCEIPQLIGSPAPTSTAPNLPPYPASASNSDPTPVSASVGVEQVSVVCSEIPQPRATPAPSLDPSLAPSKASALAPEPVPVTTPAPPPVTVPESATVPGPVPPSATVTGSVNASEHILTPVAIPFPATELNTADIIQVLAAPPLSSIPMSITPLQTATETPYVVPSKTVVVVIQPSMEEPTLPQSSAADKPVAPTALLPEPVSTTSITEADSIPLFPSIIQSTQEHVVISVPGSDDISTVPCTSDVIASTMTPTATSPSPSSFSIPSPPAAVTVLPTVPQYISTVPKFETVVSDTVSATPLQASARPVSSEPATLFRGSSQEKVDAPIIAPPPPPPLPPYTLPKYAIDHKKTHPISTHSSVSEVPVSTAVSIARATVTTTSISQTFPTYKPHFPPPVPPKPSSILASSTFSPKLGGSVVPPVSPKPAGQSIETAPPRTPSVTLNLTAWGENKLSATSPISPLSPRHGNSLHDTYVVITLPSEPGTPVEATAIQAPPSKLGYTMPTGPVEFSQYTKSIESQQIRGPDKVVSSRSHTYSSISTAGQSITPPSLPNLFTQVVTTEVQRTTVSVVHERVPSSPPVPAPRTSSVAIAIPPEAAKVQPKPKENDKVPYSCDVVDLRTLRLGIAMTEKGMDLSSPDSRRQSFSSDSSGRQTSAVQSAVVNLSAESTPGSTLSIVSDSITIVTCTATIAYSNSVGNRGRDLSQAKSMPLPLTTSKSFEPVAQIIYRPIDSQPTTSSRNVDIPVNLSFGAIASAETSKPAVSEAQASLTNGTINHAARTEAGPVGAVDLTTTKPFQTMVSVDESTLEVITTVIEDDGKPVDLTARRQAVCCDVVYKLPFARSCAAPQPLTTLPEDRFGYRDDHYQYDRSGANCTRGFGGMKPSMSDTNLAEAGLFFYKSKNSYDYQNGATEGAIDLTSGKVSTGEILGYSSKVTGAYSRMTIPSYSQARITPVVGTHFGVNSVLRSSNGVVYSSVAAPVPSMYAITTQPGSIFSSAYKGMHSSDTMPSLSTLQQQPLPRSYSFFSTTTAEQEGAARQETGVSKEAVPMVTTLPDAYTDASLGAIAASLEALASPVLSGLDSNERRQYEMEREFLELEKIKQLRLAEELEWERQEIQRFREQEQLIVQKELEELQSMKHQLLFQQEEERQAHLMMQQETYAQQQLQLEQIQQLRDQLQQQLEEQKVRQMYPYGSEGSSPSVSSEQIAQDPQCTDGVNDLYWPDHAERITQYISDVPDVSEMSKGQENLENLEIRKMLTSRTLRAPGPSEEHRTITDSLVLNDVQDGQDRVDTGRRKRSKRSVDSSVQTDDEDQDEWDTQARSRRRSRSTRYLDGEQEKQDSQVSSIAIQTVAEISVQTDPSSKKPSVRAQLDTKVEITKSPSESEETYSLRHQAGRDAERTSPQRDKRRPIPLEIGYTAHLKADSNLQVAPSPPKSPKVLYSPLSPMSPDRSIEFGPYENPQKVLHAEPSKPPPTSPRTLKAMHRSMSDPKPSSPTADERAESNFQCTDGYSGSQSGSPSGTQKKVKRTLPNTPPEEGTATGPTGYSTASARRRLCRNTTAARAKILQDIDRELDLVERESSKLRKKQAELDEEEKEIDARLRCLETGISRRKEALLKEREERERAYLQGVAEERDYMSDSEVSNIRETRGNGHGLERPRTAPQSELNQLVLPQTQPKTQYAQPTSPYTQYQYSTATQASQQALYRPQSLYHQQVTPYQTQSIYSSVPTLSYAQASRQSSQHASQMLLKQQKSRQKTMSTLEPKITANYDVAHNRPLLIVPSPSADHLGGKYNNLDLRIGLDERSSMASSPMSAISADSYYTNIEQHAPRSYTLLEDELAKAHAGLPSGYGFPDKDPTKTDRLLRATDVRRAGEVTDFLGSLQAHARLHPYMKVEEDAMEEPYELKLLKQQLKQEFQRSTDGLDHLSGLPQYHHGDSNYRNFPKTDKYSISRLTLEKQAAKQLPVSVLYPKQAKHKKTLMDPKITKFSPIQESKDISATGYSSYLASSATSISGLASRARLLQDDLTFGLRKNISEQQRYLGSTLGANLAQSLNLGQALGSTLRSSLLDDTAYPSGSRSRPSSRPNSMYGLDLSIKRDLSSSSLRLKTETEDPVYRTPSARAKPTSLPISQSRGRIPIVAQNSEEESPLSPVGQPMGMARASAGPLPPIAADNRDQFGSSHSLPEVQQHMREESRIRSSDWAAAYAMDDLQSAMSDSEAGGGSWDSEAYHLRQEEADWLDKPREAQGERGRVPDQNQVTHKHQHGEKPVPNAIPHTTVKLQRDPKDRSVSGNGLGIRVVGGKEIPGSSGEIGAYVARVLPGGIAEQTGKVAEGMQVLEWNGIPLTGKSYEEVQGLVGRQCEEAEVCIRLDINMLSESGQPQHLGLSEKSKAGDTQRSPGVDPKQLATELQKVSQQQAPATASYPPERGLHVQSGAATASPAPSPGQPGSPSVAKKRHSSRPTKTQSHPITGEIQLQLNYDRQLGNLIIHILQARSLSPGDNGSYSDPFVKVYLLPGRGQVMVVQNASAENKRRDRHVQKSLNPEWNQTVIYKNIHLEQLKKKTLEVTVWDYDRFSSNDFLGEVLISLSNFAQLDNVPHWFPLKEQSEGVDHGRAQSSPKPPVIKSRSHSVLPDSSKDTQVPTIEKSHSNPDSSKPSSEVHLRPHTPSRNRNRGGVAQGQLDNGPQTRLQQTVHRGVSPSHSKKQHRHSVAGVLTIHRTQSDSLPVLANESKDTSQLTMRKAMSEETPKNAGARSGLLGADASISGLGGSAFNLECEDGSDAVDSAIFQVPQIGKNILHDTSRARGPDPPGLGDTEGKTQAMGEIKVALKKDMKIEGEQLVVEILQCRNITYKFKSSEHLPDLYVKLYVVNVATQKRVIKKKTRVCRHDREPSFNETFRFSINPAGHSIQLFLVSNGGKFVKKTLIGEAYIWLDKVDLRKRSVSWHQLLASSTQMHP